MTQVATQMTHRIPPDCGAEAAERGFSAMAQRMQASSILTIAAQIRSLKEAGVELADLTVGDYDPNEFPLPPTLKRALQAAIEAGEANYPPAPGVRQLREAVVRHVKRTQGLEYPVDSVVIFGGARPGLYSIYRLLLDAGDTVLYPVPSWNNSNFRDVCDVKARVLRCEAENAFQPTAAALAEQIEGVRLLVLNSPQNPSGGVMPPEEMERIGHLLVEENQRRKDLGEQPLYLMLDQIYRALTFEGNECTSPVQHVPECADYVIHIDGISKFCAATGLRVGWAICPPAIAKKISALLTHVGAWAPRPAQIATAEFLDDVEACTVWERDMTNRVEERLQMLYDGIKTLESEGLPIEVIAPQGAIYLSVRFGLIGKSTSDGLILANNDDVRTYLLKEAGFGVVPFSAFGATDANNQGWFRASVGAVSKDGIISAIPRLRTALGNVS